MADYKRDQSNMGQERNPNNPVTNKPDTERTGTERPYPADKPDYYGHDKDKGDFEKNKDRGDFEKNKDRGDFSKGHFEPTNRRDMGGWKQHQ